MCTRMFKKINFQILFRCKPGGTGCYGLNKAIEQKINDKIDHNIIFKTFRIYLPKFMDISC